MVAFLSSGHYRQPMEFSEEALEQAEARVERVRNFLAERGRGERRPEFVAERREAFLDALADDFNTPKAWAELFDLIAEGNRRPLPGAREAVAEMLSCSGSRRCWRPATAPTPRPRSCSPNASAPAQSATSRPPTAIRDQLAELGWQVRDTPDGARLVRKG